tara:strand:+ start:239 stop:853 length:615 start_codon:yes stop_codon:yes gene_type:complete
MAFPSVYEMTNPLTTVRKQHFWEYFSGATLNSRWTRFFSGGTAGMHDSVNGGYQMSGSAVNEGIWFNDINQYAHNGSVMVFASYGTYTTRSKAIGGLGDNSNTTLTTINKASIHHDTASGVVGQTADGSSETATAMTGSNLQDGVLGTYKIETKSSSVEFSDSGVIKATNTTNLPTAKMEPVFIMSSVTGASTMGVVYVECYNT